MGVVWDALPPLLTDVDLADRYGCTPATIRRRWRAGKLPRPVDPDAKSPRWHPAVIAEHETGVTPPAPASLRSVS